MTDSSSRRVRITPAAPSAAQSRARKQFNTLIKKLETERKRLAEWHDTLPELNRISQETFMPLANAVNACRKQVTMMLDRAWDHPGMTKRDKEKLADLVCGAAMDLLDSGYDAELAAIVEKYTGESPGDDDDAMTPEELAQFKQEMEHAFGIDLGDAADFTTHEELFDALDMHMSRPDAQSKSKSQSKPQDDAADQSAPPPPAGKRELQRQAEAARLKQSVREIYRKLVSSLHPDREPDTDERTRKTALMQRVNAAYEKDDLLGLLELQFEIDQIDQASLDNLGEERIAQYNKILKSQLDELDREIGQLEFGLQMELGLDFERRPKPAFLLAQLNKEIAQVRRDLAECEAELEEFQDIKQLKAFLKTYRIPKPDPYGYDGW